MQHSPNDLSDQLDLAVAMAKNERYPEALGLLDTLLESNGHEAKIWATRAFVNECEGNREAALADWSKAISLCEEPHYFFMRGIMRFQMGSYREAICDFTKVIELSELYESDYYKGPAYFFRADSHLRIRAFDAVRSDLAHVRDDMSTWTDKLRTKADILSECE